MTKSKAVLNRFLKAFTAGGIASVSTLLSNGVTFSTIEEIRALVFSFAVAFLTGGIMALEKHLNWQDAPKA